jgi:hypothetical protein
MDTQTSDTADAPEAPNLIDDLESVLDSDTFGRGDGEALADKICDEIAAICAKVKGGTLSHWDLVFADYRSRLAQRLGDYTAGLVKVQVIQDVLDEHTGEED